MVTKDLTPPDLANLIDSAADEVATTSATRETRAKKVRRPSLLRPIFSAALIAAALYLGHGLWRYHAPPTSEQVAQDLERALDLARTSIEEIKANTGMLPKALPNASLAAVVRYEPDRDEYRLVATMMGVRITLQKDGTKSTDMGVSQ
jgi:hypothetical protein